jgi:hypothetical protein
LANHNSTDLHISPSHEAWLDRKKGQNEYFRSAHTKGSSKQISIARRFGCRLFVQLTLQFEKLLEFLRGRRVAGLRGMACAGGSRSFARLLLSWLH